MVEVGGVCIYKRDDLCSVEVDDPKLNRNEIEQVWCEIGAGNEKVLLGCIYRPPNCTNNGI